MVRRGPEGAGLDPGTRPTPVTGTTAADGDEDELRDAIDHAERWEAMHPCPVPQLGEELAHLVDTWSAVVGEGGPGATDGASQPIRTNVNDGIRELSDDTVRLQAKVDAELLPGQ